MTKKMTTLSALVDSSLAVEKLRVSAEVRQTHLFLDGLKRLVSDKTITQAIADELEDNWKKKRVLPNIVYARHLHDPETDELRLKLIDLEKYIDGRVASLIQSHPAYPWFSLVRGVGKENIGKVIATIDIEIADTISSLWKYAGYSVDDGTAPRRTKGEKLHYNSQLRSMCWRLGGSLLKARGKFYDYYLKEKEKYQQKFTNKGVQIVPAKSLPKKSGKTYEPEDMISEGHLHNMALRKTIKLFLACLWLSWREEEKLPITSPYPIGQLGHKHPISPWDMTDKEKERD